MLTLHDITEFIIYVTLIIAIITSLIILIIRLVAILAEPEKYLTKNKHDHKYQTPPPQSQKNEG